MTVQTHELHAVSPRPRSGWATAAMAAVVALTLGIGGVVGAFLVNGRGAGMGTLAAFAPADAAMYSEVDLTLPGAQRANLAALLDHWSAVDPDLLLGDQFAGFVDGLVDTSVPFTYTDDLAPWLSGQFAIVLRSWPASPSDPMAITVPEAALVIGSRDDAAATVLADRMRDAAADEGGLTFTSTEHGGVTIWSTDDASGGMVGNAEFAYAVTDGAVVIATGADEVGRALDTRSSDATLAANAEIGRLVAALPSERVAMTVIDTRAAMDGMLADLGDASPALAESLGAYVAGIPDHAVASLSFEADRAVITNVTELGDGPFAMRSLSSAMAERIPAEALFYAAMPDIGQSIGSGIDLFLAGLAADPFAGPMAQEWIDGFESKTGVAVGDLFSWADDAAAYVAWDGNQPSGGLIALTNDAAAARSQVDALVEALVGEAGSQVTVETDSIGDAEVTRLVGGGGMPPVEIAIGRESVSITFGEGVAANLAELEAPGSLAGVDRFTDAIGSVGGDATSAAAWIDLAGIVDAIAASMPEQSTMSMMVLGNLEPLDFIVGASHEEDGLTVSRTDIVVR